MDFIMRYFKNLSKMKHFLLPIFLLISYLGFAQAPSGYYDSAEGLSRFQLKTALKNIIDSEDDGSGFPFHQDQGYGALYDAYASENSGDTDDYFEEDGTVLDMYSEIPNGEEAYNYEHFQNQCGNYSGEGDCYNREHLVPQSTFNSASPMKNDYFHVVPSDGSVNGARGSFPFGEVNQPSYVSSNGSKRGPNTFSGYEGTVFEPLDEFKGDIARSILYFAIRYEDEFSTSWKKNEVLADNPQDFFVDWYIDLLLSWHTNDPVSQREIDRNNNGYQFQGNRNPLIDRPEFAYQIWGETDNQPPSAPQNLQAVYISDSSVELSWEPSEDNIGINKYIIEQDNVNIAEVTSEILNFEVEDLSPETLYNFRVYAIDLSDNISDPSENLEVVTLAESNILFYEDFENCSSVLSNFTSVSEQSSIDWECRQTAGENSSQAYQMNAFQNGQQVPSLDWLITTNTLNFDNHEVEKMSFWTSASFGNTKLELLYSSTYDGNGNPSNFEWEEIPNVSIPLHPDGTSSLFVYEATDIDISEITGEVYIAFRYDTTDGQEATRWSVDNILITAEQLLSNYQFSKPLEVVLYPNPTKNSKVNLDFNLRGHKTIEIFDVSGKRLLSTQTYRKNYEGDVSQFSSGSYFVKIEQKGNSIVKRLIIK